MNYRLFPGVPFVSCALLSFLLIGCGKRPPAQDSAAGEAPSSAQVSPLPVKGINLAEERPGAALPAISGLASAGEQAQLAHDLAARLSPDDLRKWAAELAAMPFSVARDTLLIAVLEKLAATSPAEAMRLALSIGPAATTHNLAKAVAGVWATSDFWALYQFSTTLPQKSLRDDLQRIAVTTWSDGNPDGAFHYLAKVRFDDGGNMIWIPARRLGERNADDAMTALDQIQDPRVWDTAAGRIFEAMAQNDLHGAVDLFFSQKDPKVEKPLAYALGSTFAVGSLPDGIDVLNRIQDKSVAASFVFGMIQSQKGANLQPLQDQIPRIADPDVRYNAALFTGKDLANLDPAQATKWLPTLVDEETQAQAYQGAGMGYADKDSQAAQAWLNTLPPGKDRRYAIFGFASEYSAKDPVTSSNWAMTIVEPDIRALLVKIVLRNWVQSDPAAAQTWAQQTGYQNLIPHH